MARRIAFGIVAAFLAMAPVRLLAAPSAAGQVLALAGACVAESGAQRTTLKTGDTVNVGDKIEVPAGGKLRLRMEDGSVLSIAAGSTMTIQSYTGGGPGQPRRDARMTLTQGLVRAVVASVTQPSTFEITTATGVAAARSTDWFVETEPSGTRVGVLEGTVAVTRPSGGAAVLVPPHEGTSIAMGRAPAAATVWPQSAFDALISRTALNNGWCQCIDERTLIQAACRPSVDACQAYCAGHHYSFLVNAPQTCGVLP